MKQKTIVFTGHTCSPALIAFGKSIGAQFRNGHLAEDTQEPCDYVAGHPIPASYADVEIHPDWPEDGIDALPEVEAEGTAGKQPDQEPPKKDDEEIEVTAEYLEGLTKKQMLELVDEEGLDFTAEQKKNAANLLAALKAHYEV